MQLICRGYMKEITYEHMNMCDLKTLGMFHDGSFHIW